MPKLGSAPGAGPWRPRRQSRRDEARLRTNVHGETVMLHANRVRFAQALVGIVIIGASAGKARAQESYAPPNDLPNPYGSGVKWCQLSDDRKWGSTSGVMVGPDANIWTYDRCGGNSCADS